MCQRKCGRVKEALESLRSLPLILGSLFLHYYMFQLDQILSNLVPLYNFALAFFQFTFMCFLHGFFIPTFS